MNKRTVWISALTVCDCYGGLHSPECYCCVGIANAGGMLLLRPNFVPISPLWEQMRSTWDLNALCGMVSVRVPTFFRNPTQDEEITPFSATPRAVPGWSAAGRLALRQGCRAETPQWRRLHNAVACTATGIGRADAWEGRTSTTQSFLSKETVETDFVLFHFDAKFVRILAYVS